MNEIAKLQAKADESRDRFRRTLRALEERSTLMGLADDMLARVGGAPHPNEILEALRRKPLLAVALAVCGGLLVMEVNQLRQARLPDGRRRKVPRRTALLNPPRHTKESHHGR